MKPISVLVILLFTSFNTLALNTKQLLDACQANARPCHELPFANAYVGGALDLLGSLRDSGKLRLQFSCQSTDQLFKAKRILTYMEEHQKGYEDKNAMMLVIKYMEEENCAED